MENLKLTLKEKIIERLDLDLKAEEIKDDEALFDQGLDIDSLDSLEIIVIVGKEFGVQISDDDFEALHSINTLAAFIEQHREK